MQLILIVLLGSALCNTVQSGITARFPQEEEEEYRVLEEQLDQLTESETTATESPQTSELALTQQPSEPETEEPEPSEESKPTEEPEPTVEPQEPVGDCFVVCSAQSPLTDGCGPETEGYVRYNPLMEIPEYCTDGYWIPKVPNVSSPPPPPPPSPLGSEDNPAQSCQALIDEGQTEEGVYYIKPNDGVASFETFCKDGYTLVLKVNGRENTFEYDSSLWSSKEGFQVDENLIDNVEVLLPSYWTMPIQEVMIVMEMENGSITELKIPYVASSLYDVIADGNYKWTAQGREAWKSLVPDSSLQYNCNMEGFNVNPNPNPVNHRVRIGIVSNNENDCWTVDSHLGVGGGGYTCIPNDAIVVSGNAGACDADNGDKVIYTFATVLIK